MINFYRIIMALGLSIVLIGCSKSSGKNRKNDGNGNGPTPIDNPKTAEEAIKRLSSFHLKQYEDWKDSVVKSCSSNSIFSNSESHPLDESKKVNKEIGAIDAQLLLKKNSNSALLTNGTRSVLVNSFRAYFGEYLDKTYFSSDFNGVKYELLARTVQEGSKCSLYLYEQKVFETDIVKTMNLGLAISENFDQKLESKVASKIAPVGRRGLSELYAPGLVEFFQLVLKPTAEDRDFVAKKFGIPQELAGDIITINRSFGSDISIRISGEETALWNRVDTHRLVASTSALQKNLDAGKQLNAIEMRSRLPHLRFGEVTNSSDSGTYSVDLKVVSEKLEDKVVYSLESAGQSGFKPFLPSEARDCIESRVSGYLIPQGGENKNSQIVPSVGVALEPCHILIGDDLYQFALNSGLFKSLVPVVFRGVEPSKIFLYSDWDVVFSKLALTAFDQGKDLNEEFDPNRQTTIVSQASRVLNIMAPILANFRNLIAEKKLFYSMAMSWVFSNYAYTDAKIRDAFSVLDRVINSFRASTFAIIDCLTRNPESCSASLEFANSIDDAYKSKSLATLALSQEIDYGTFQRMFDSIFQIRPSLEVIDGVYARLTLVKAAMAPFSNISKIKMDLVESSMSWLEKGELTSEDLPKVYQAFDNTILFFPSSAEQLLNQFRKSAKDSNVSIIYASQVTQEAKDLATSILSLSKSIDLEEKGVDFFNTILQKRPSLEYIRQLQLAWSSSFKYTADERSRLSQVPEYSRDNEARRKEIIEVAIQDLWTSNHFSDLSNIAEVARLNDSCSRRGPGVSSVISCIDFTYSSFRLSENSFFNPKFGSRYGLLAKNYSGWVRGVLANKDVSSFLGRDLISRFFGLGEPIWSKCIQLEFDEKSKKLETQISSLLVERDQFKRWDLETAIKSTIQNCEK
jgi:hypothetical protein